MPQLAHWFLSAGEQRQAASDGLDSPDSFFISDLDCVKIQFIRVKFLEPFWFKTFCAKSSNRSDSCDLIYSFFFMKKESQTSPLEQQTLLLIR